MRTLILLFAFFSSFQIYGQINVGSIEQVKFKPGKLDQEDLNGLKESKTIFLYRESDKENLESFKSALKEAWNYTELEFVAYNEFSTNDYDKSYSFFTIGGVHKAIMSSSGMSLDHVHVYLTLWKNNGKEDKTYCRIELYTSFSTYLSAMKFGSNEKRMEKFLYDESSIHNWNTLYLKNALQFVSDKLENDTEHWLFESNVYSDMSVLSKSTLYIPKYTLIRFAPMTGDESKRHDAEKLLKNYPYPHEIVPMDELLDRAKDSDEPFYYLSYIKSNTDKFITIVNGVTGEILYSDYSGGSYNIKSKDFKSIAKAIKKGQ